MRDYDICQKSPFCLLYPSTSSLFQELSKSFKNQLGNVSKVDVLEEIWLRTFWSYNDKEVIVIGNCRVISTLIWDVNL